MARISLKARGEGRRRRENVRRRTPECPESKIHRFKIKQQKLPKVSNHFVASNFNDFLVSWFDEFLLNSSPYAEVV